MTRRLNCGVYYIGSPPFCHHTALSLFEHIEVELTKLGNNRGGVSQDRQLNSDQLSCPQTAERR